MLRRSLTLASAVALGFIATSCGSTTSPAAATINGVEIEDKEFQENLKSWVAFDAGNPNSSGTSVPGQVPTALAAQALSVEIRFRLANDEAAVRNVTATPEDLTDARTLVTGGQTGETPFDSFSTRYGDYIVASLATQTALGRVLVDEVAASQPQLRSRCLSHILVETPEQAAAVISRLDADEEFATLAAELSIDPGSAQTGGELRGQSGQCDTIAAILTNYVPEFGTAAADATVGEPTAPVKSDFGYHIILVTEEQPPSASASYELWAADAATKAEVTINPKYGTWDATTGFVTAPAAPQTPSTKAPETPTSAGS